MRTVDFTRPTKFTADQERRIKRALETFCRTASTRLSAELRMPLELEVINVSQLTWGNAHGQVPPRSVSCLIDVPDVPTRMLLSAEMNLVMSAIELLLGGGGTDGASQRERRLTDIDWALARHFLDRLIAQLSIVWHDITDVELGVAGLDMHLETAQTAPVSEPTLGLTMEARMDRDSATLALLLPYSAIAPVAHRFSSRDDVEGIDDEHQASAVREAVGRVEMTVRAEVAAVDLPIERVLALQPGDVLRLDARADEGVTLYADAVPIHRAMPGRSGGRRAVQVTDRLGGTP
jgi:flagellar motor switch protein FliM